MLQLTDSYISASLLGNIPIRHLAAALTGSASSGKVLSHVGEFIRGLAASYLRDDARYVTYDELIQQA